MADVGERRRQIMRAAVEVFAERGFAEATISDIADAAGLAHGTIYLYFKSKADVFRSMVADFVDLLIAELNGTSEGAGGRLSDDLFRMFHRSLQLCAENPRATAACMRETITGGPELAAGLQELTRSLLDQVADRIRRAIEAGEARPIAPDLAAFLVVNLLAVAMQRLLALGDEARTDAGVEELAREIVAFVRLGLGDTTWD